MTTRHAARPPLLGLWDRLLPAESWHAWELCARAIFGLTAGLSAEDSRFIGERTGGRAVPTSQAREAWIVVGRRGGKSRTAALIAVYLACFRHYHLAPGERGVVMLICPDRRQARVVFRYIAAFLHASPALDRLIERRTKDTLDLSNQVSIEVQTASFRTTRGYTVVAAVLDELAFWPTEDAAEPDTEILNALRPAMATVPGALLVAISSPYAKRGELWNAYEEHYGKDSSGVLVWQADTRTMNPTVDAAVISRAYVDDPVVAAAEWGAEFRSDIESFVPRELLPAVVATGQVELPPSLALTYVGFVDPSGGSSDSMTLAIAHNEVTGARLDLLRETKPPFSPEAVVTDFAAVLKRYRVTRVTGDRYAGEWCAEAFRRHGIQYRTSDKTKSEIYAAFLPLLTSKRATLLDHPRLISQLATLERRTGRSGKDSIDHQPGAHDDLANVCAGAAVYSGATIGRPRLPNYICWKEANQPGFSELACFLSGEGFYMPGFNDPCCSECAGLQAVRTAYREHVAKTGENTTIRLFFADHMQPAERAKWAALRAACKMNPVLT